MACFMLFAAYVAVAPQAPVMARAHAAQENINPRAQEDIKAFVQKVEEGDTLFNQKKYAEAAAALAAAHSLYQRAERRDENVGYFKITLKAQTFPALRFYGYGMGANASLGEDPTGAIKGTAAGFHSAANAMWMDASILSDAAKVPLAGAFNDPPLVEMSEEQLNSVLRDIYGPVSRFMLPVGDDEWGKVVRMSRRAQLIVEYALRTHPEWKTGTREWGSINGELQHTGDQALADIKAKLTEAEPEYQKVAADFRKAEPPGVAQAIGFELEKLNTAIASVKRNGWLDWTLARDLYISKDFLAERRPQIAKLYAAEGKTMPADRLKPVEDKIAELNSAIEANAPRWHFPSGKPHDAAIEARARAAIKAKFPGATILKTALDGTDWKILKNDLGLPRYRTRGVLVLLKIPGQKWPWLVLGSYDQSYAGGGTYNPGGTFALAESYSEVRVQSAP
jgi:hypothetical protein